MIGAWGERQFPIPQLAKTGKMQGAGGEGAWGTPNLRQCSRWPVFANPEGFENWAFCCSDVAFKVLGKRCKTAWHSHFLARSATRMPANSQVQNLIKTLGKALRCKLSAAEVDKRGQS